MKPEDYEIVPANEKRARKVGNHYIRESRVRLMEKNISDGMHFCDAAEKAGIPFEIALQRMEFDEEFRQWFLLSKDRPRVISDPSADLAPDALTPMEMKHEMLRQVWRAGLPGKVAEVIALADPSTPVGANATVGVLKVVKDLFPRETTSKNEHVDPNEGKTKGQLEERIQELLAEKRLLEQNHEEANEQLKRLADEQGDRPESD